MIRTDRVTIVICFLLVAMVSHVAIADWSNAPVRAAQQEVQFAKSFNALKTKIGPAGEGNVWHHIVEQRAANINQFGAEAIHNTQNVVSVSRGVNQNLANYYSTVQPFTQGQTVRQWLGSQS
ncbi:MAG: hypothetical protein ISS69_14790 [Phycisphaerae bacterium]|nr:hypothetical protein [Phycisphaerae bacterium]